MHEHEILIVGAGPLGLALALMLQRSGRDVLVADARSPEAAAADPRVLALAHGTRLTLEQLGVWHELPATAISTIHISQQGSFGRTILRASDYELPALGHVLAAGVLATALRKAVDAAGITVLDETRVTTLAPGADELIASFTGAHAGTRSAQLAACAEGALSGDGPDVIERDYGQHALIAHVGIAEGHRSTAYERFTASGPVALLPCGDGYAVVHVVAAASADEILQLPDDDYLARLQVVIGQRVKLVSIRERLRYPLGLRYRTDPVGERTVWLGNAAQTLHPVAGQGFNLALRDVHALAQTLGELGGDPGSAASLLAYSRSRRLDRSGTIRFTDGLVRLFSNSFAPLRHARGAGLFALDMCPPLRHFVARRMMFGARAWP